MGRQGLPGASFSVALRVPHGVLPDDEGGLLALEEGGERRVLVGHGNAQEGRALEVGPALLADEEVVVLAPADPRRRTGAPPEEARRKGLAGGHLFQGHAPRPDERQVLGSSPVEGPELLVEDLGEPGQATA